MPDDEQLVILPACKKCPHCGHFTLPIIEEGSIATATRCSSCGMVVTANGTLEGVLPHVPRRRY